MRDYFRPFLLKNSTMGGHDLGALNSETFDKIKIHLVWAAIAGGVGFAAWKAGQWQSAYKMVKRKLED